MTNRNSREGRLRAERAAGRAAAKERFVESHKAALEAIPVELKSLKARLHLGRRVAMKSHQVIDHLLFRKLFAETFSSVPYGFEGASKDYVIEPAGVRWRMSEGAYIADQERKGCSPCSTATISHVENVIRPATQAFLCSTDQVLAWANRQSGAGEIYVPDWLINALSQDDTDTALTILADAGLSVYDVFAQAQAQGDFEGQRRSRDELRNLTQAIQAFEAIKELLSSRDLSKPTSNVNMGVVVQIQGRDAIPVRALPLVTGWRMQAEVLAKLLSEEPGYRWHNDHERVLPRWLTAYLLVPGEQPRPIRPEEWEPVLIDVEGLLSDVYATERDSRDGLARWRRENMRCFPPGCFVWRDEFEERIDHPNKVVWFEDGKPGSEQLVYTPLFVGDARAMIMAGFEEPAVPISQLHGKGASAHQLKPKQQRSREGDDAIQLALKTLNAGASSVPSALEAEVRRQLLEAAEKAPGAIGFRAEKGVLQTCRKGNWSECDSQALTKRIQTQLGKMFPH